LRCLSGRPFAIPSAAPGSSRCHPRYRVGWGSLDLGLGDAQILPLLVTLPSEVIPRLTDIIPLLAEVIPPLADVIPRLVRGTFCRTVPNQVARTNRGGP
jgi:hypothetical protein